MTPPKPARPRRKRSENLDAQRMHRLYEAVIRCSRATRDRADRARLGAEVPAILDLKGGDVLVTVRVTPSLRLIGSAEEPHTLRAKTRRSTLPVQLGVAAGIALRGCDERRRALVTVFAEDADRDAWRDALLLASRRKLPLIFFLFSRDAGLDRLLADANQAGVASMIVDAADSVAVYRVCQEAQLRARMGDGPAFIIAHLPTPSSRPDPLASLTAFLRQHKYPVDDWDSAISRRLRRATAKRGKAKSRAKTPKLDLPLHVIRLHR